MAAVARDLFINGGLLSTAKTEFQRFRAANEFRNPIGPEMTQLLAMGALK
jgi:hypothetical protein